MGSGKAPSRSTTFESSATTTIRSDARATTFSHSRQAPPPLIMLPARSISSGPSMVTGELRDVVEVGEGDAELQREVPRRRGGRDLDDVQPVPDPDGELARESVGR